MNFIKTFEQHNTIELNTYSGREFINIVNDLNLDNIKYYHPRSDFNELENIYFFTIQVDNEIVGLAHIRCSPYIENTFWISYLSIKEKYQGNGYATLLSEYIFKWFKKRGIQLEGSSYSEKGWIKLKPLFNKLAKKYSVPFIDKDKL